MKTASTKKSEIGLEEMVAPAKITVPMKMTAAVLYGSEDLRVEQIEVPSIGAEEVLLRVRLALTDGTDLKVWKRGYHAKMIQPPAVFGHEVVGEIVAMGKRVDAKWRLGTRVIAANSAPCFRCYHCRRGQENLCDDLLFNNGAYAEYMRIPGRIVCENMLEVPYSVDDHSAALVEPLACVLRGIHEMEVRTDDTTAVIGCGPIGLKYVRMLSRRGIRVIAVARREAPLAVARRLGASATINVTQVPDVVAAVRELTEDKRGPDSVVEAAGNPATWQQALKMVRRGGMVNFFSGLPTGTHVEIEPAAIHYSEIKMISPFHHTPRFIREALDAVRRGDVTAEAFVTEEIPLGELPQAFARMKARSGEIKLAVRP
ncbi:MAG TPA: zinc-binding dehydrogenase [Candidatus Limnocylindrales bacterium]|nr:zinc-binding dehydrogenase [Candidatus Limnocylindrales bacterium]